MSINKITREDGSIDARLLTNMETTAREWVAAETCAAIRRRLAGGETTPEVAADLDRSDGAIRDHAAGRYRHDDGPPALVYVYERGRGWMRKSGGNP